MKIQYENETERALVEGNYREDVAATIGEGRHPLPLVLDVTGPDPPHVTDTNARSVAAAIERAAHKALSRQMSWRACAVEVRDGSVSLKVPKGISLRPDELVAIAAGVEHECSRSAELTNRANVEHVRELPPVEGPPLAMTFPKSMQGAPMPPMPGYLKLDGEDRFAASVKPLDADQVRESVAKRELRGALGDVLNRRR